MPNEWEMRQREDAKNAVNDLSHYANNMGHSAQYFAEHVMREHRTLQQSIFGLFMACVQEWDKAEDGGFFDLRNEYTVKKSAAIMDAKIFESGDKPPMI